MVVVVGGGFREKKEESKDPASLHWVMGLVYLHNVSIRVLHLLY